MQPVAGALLWMGAAGCAVYVPLLLPQLLLLPLRAPPSNLHHLTPPTTHTHLQDCPEKAVFDAVMVWAGYGAEVAGAASACHPMADVDRLLPCIRFPLMTDADLEAVRCGQGRGWRSGGGGGQSEGRVRIRSKGEWAAASAWEGGAGGAIQIADQQLEAAWGKGERGMA